MAFLVIQTAYIIYIMHSMPHTESMFNKLEFFNEGMIVLMCYIMFVFAGVGDRAVLMTDIPLYICMGISSIIVAVNILVMVRIYIQTAKQRIHQAKLKKAGLLVDLKERALAKEIELEPITPMKDPLTRVSLCTPLTVLKEESKENEQDDVHVESFDNDREIRKDLEDLNDILVPDQFYNASLEINNSNTIILR